MGGATIAAKPETVDFQLVPDASGEETSLDPNLATRRARVRFFLMGLIFLESHLVLVATGIPCSGLGLCKCR